MSAADVAVPVSASVKCPICLDEMRDRAVVIPCCHDFDFRCINEWTSVNSNCPVCRTAMESIHHNIKSNTTFCIQMVVPTASASQDHEDDDYDSDDFDSDLEMDAAVAGVDLDFISDGEDVPVFQYSFSQSPSNASSLSLQVSSTPTPPVSPVAVSLTSSPAQPADGTIVLSSDDEDDDADDASSLSAVSVDASVYEEPAEGEVLILPENGELIQVDDYDDEENVASDDETDGGSGIDYGDEPEDWADEFETDGDGFDPDYDAFEDSNPCF